MGFYPSMLSRNSITFLATAAFGMCIALVFWFLRDVVPVEGYSNILPDDYLGPEACIECHEEKHQLWSNHSHSVMNQNPTEETVLGDFSNQRLEYAGGSILFSTKGGDYFMTLERGGAALRRYRVTRTVGSKFIQFYIGVQTEGPEPKPHDLYDIEHKLDFGYLLKRKQWLPQMYFDPSRTEYKRNGTLRDDPFNDPRAHPWGNNCLICHNTYPYITRLRSGYPSGFPRSDIHRTKRNTWLEQSDFPPVDIREPEKSLVTLGISCESCHFGGREHVENKQPMAFVPTHPDLKIQPSGTTEGFVPDRADPYVIDGICSQCHRAVVDRYPNGSATWNSAEAEDLAASACAIEALCTNCHNPHKAGPKESGPPDGEHIRACVRCHETYQDFKVVQQHTKHPVDADVSCLDCHMPAFNMGLDRVVRSHTISSPTDQRMYDAGAPNACSLCHLDRSIAWVMTSLERNWGVEIEKTPELQAAYGGLGKAVGMAWLKGTNPDMRKVAAQSYGRSPLGEQALPKLLRSLDDPIPTNRLFTLMAIEEILGWQIPDDQYNITAVSEIRKQQILELLKSLPESNLPKGG